MADAAQVGSRRVWRDAGDVLALKAITAYSSARARAMTPGTVTLVVNGKEAGQPSYQPGDREPPPFAGLQNTYRRQNRIELRHTGQTPLPYSLGVSYRSTSQRRAQMRRCRLLRRSSAIR